MIAIPLKTNKENSAVAPLFGKAKWFAFVEGGKIGIEKNELQGGASVVAWLLQKGVNTLIIQKMSNPPYQMIKEDGQIGIFYAGDKRIELNEVLKKHEENELEELNDTNANGIIKDHERQHRNH